MGPYLSNKNGQQRPNMVNDHPDYIEQQRLLWEEMERRVPSSWFGVYPQKSKSEVMTHSCSPWKTDLDSILLPMSACTIVTLQGTVFPIFFVTNSFCRRLGRPARRMRQALFIKTQLRSQWGLSHPVIYCVLSRWAQNLLLLESSVEDPPWIKRC